jgi:hypothetical protein
MNDANQPAIWARELNPSLFRMIALDVTRSAPDGARANPQPEGVAVRPEL